MSLSKSKPYLNDPERIAVITKHRNLMGYSRPPLQKEEVTPDLIDPWVTFEYDVDEVRKEVNEQNKEIYWDEMVGKGSRTFVDRFIELTVIEEFVLENASDSEGPLLSLESELSPNFLVEDKKGAAITLQFFGVDPNAEEDCEIVKVGMKILLVDPVVRFGPWVSMKSNYWLHVDRKTDPNFIIPVGRKTDMCRYCGEENAKMKCANCKYAYCGKECQLADWKVLKHKLVCKIEDGAGASGALPKKSTEAIGGNTTKSKKMPSKNKKDKKNSKNSVEPASTASEFKKTASKSTDERRERGTGMKSIKNQTDPTSGPRPFDMAEVAEASYLLREECDRQGIDYLIL